MIIARIGLGLVTVLVPALGCTLISGVADLITGENQSSTSSGTGGTTSSGTGGATTSGTGGSTSSGTGGSTVSPCSCCAGYAMDDTGTCTYEDLSEASAALWDAIGDCTCGTADTAGACWDPDYGVEDCLNSCGGGTDEDPDCMTCVQANCPTEVSDCLNDAACTG